MPRIDDGFSTQIDLPAAGVTLWEKEVTPPGIDAGGPIDTSTMRNLQLRTKIPKSLKTMTQMRLRVAYDPAFYNNIFGAVGINQQIQVTFPDLSILGFWGWLDKFTPDPLREGEQPTAECIIECSNQDNNGDEQNPTYTTP